MKRMLSYFCVVLLSSIAFFSLIRVYFQTGVPYTHDGENHLARFANFKLALKEGQFPPRFAPNLVNHYGYPVFNYNYPLANILSLPFSLFRVHYETTFKVLMATGLFLGAVGIYRWLSLMDTSKTTRFIAITAYLAAPFTVNLIYVRGNPGEIWAMALFPWLLWLTLSISKRKIPSLFICVSIITAFLLSHNISVLFGGIVWALYSLSAFGNNISFWKTWLGIMGLALLLSSWFWLPALAEKHLVILDGAKLNTYPGAHTATPSQLILSPLQFGYSYSTPVDTLSFAIGLSSLGGLFLSTIWLIKYAISKNASPVSHFWFYSIMCWILIILQLPISHLVWETLPLARFIQFPWRLTAFIIVLSTPLIAMVATTNSIIRKVLVGVLIAQILVIWRLHPIDIIQKSPVEYDLFSQSTSTAHENTPTSFTFQTISDWSPEPRILSGEGIIEVERWTGSSRTYTIQADTDLIVAEPTMYFPGWETRVNDTSISHTDNKEIAGRIAYTLAPGEHRISTRFTQHTWPRLVGNTLSMVAIFIWGWLVWQEKYRSSGK